MREGARRGIVRTLPWFLLVLVTGYYARSAGYGYNHDDEFHIRLQQPQPGPADVLRVFTQRHYPILPYYRPVTWMTFLAQKSLHGDRPSLFHLVNALLMGCVAAVGYLVLKGPPFLVPPPVAAALVLLFAIHPACSSVVYPATGRETLLPALLMLASTRYFFRDGGFASTGAFVFFVLALFSKEQAVALPLVFLLAEALRLVPREPRRLLSRLGGYLGVLAGYLLIRLALFGREEAHWHFTSHPLDPLLTYLYAVQSSFTPFRHVVYEPPFSVWFSPARLLVASILCLGLAAAAARLRRVRGRELLFWAGWFVILQLPSANILWQDAMFDERYLFASLFGLFAVTALVVAQVRARRVLFAVPALIVMAVWVEAGVVRGREFGSSFEFFKRWRESNPDSWIARFNYGTDLMKRGDRAAAWAEMEAARALNPTVDILVKMGRYAIEEGRFETAAAFLQQAADKAPRDAAVRSTLGWVHEKSGNLVAAEAQLRTAVALNPAAAVAQAGLGALLARSGRPGEAVEPLREAARLAPGNPATLNNLGRALFDSGGCEEAVGAFLQARRLDAGDPVLMLNLAEAYACLGDRPAAIGLLADAIPLARELGDRDLEGHLADLLARWQGGRP